MKKLKNNKGITLVSLMVTIIILLIISSVTITVSVSQFDSMQLKGFYTKLEVAQEGVNKIAETDEKYKDTDGNEISIKNYGQTPTQEQISLIESLGKSADNFKFFTANEVRNVLDISGVDMNLLIDFDNRDIISADGIEVKGKKYYVLENNKYNVVSNGDKNNGEVNFSCTAESISEDKYKIIIDIDSNVGDVKKGNIQYKKSYWDYWKATSDKEIVVNELTSYDIKYTDANNNSCTKNITLSQDKDNDNALIVTEN